MRHPVQLFGPGNEVRYAVERQKSGAFNLVAPAAGSYRLCFESRTSAREAKAVAFSLHKGGALFQDIAKQGAYHIPHCCWIYSFFVFGSCSTGEQTFATGRAATSIPRPLFRFFLCRMFLS